MRIGQLARSAGTQPETVRYYERLGLLPRPERSEGNYRIYHQGHLERLRFIRKCRAARMPLAEVRRLLFFRDRPESACHEINHLLDTHIDRLQTEISALRELESHLRDLRTRCDTPRTAGDCGILAALDSYDAAAPPLEISADVEAA
ncbi:MAG: Cd(II)/Pb(II)-responsive transcriptional regulator [bacterium]